jgi:hypothetical protein
LAQAIAKVTDQIDSYHRFGPMRPGKRGLLL